MRGWGRAVTERYRGNILVAPVLSHSARTSPTADQEECNHEETEDFTAEVTLLQNVLQSLEAEAETLHTKLQSTGEEVTRLKTELSLAHERLAKLWSIEEEVKQLETELSEANERLVVLWQENCKQLLSHDVAMEEKDREVQLLREQLQLREMELARLKLANLKERRILAGNSITSTTSRENICPKTVFTSQGVPLARDRVPASFPKEGTQQVPVYTTSCFPLATKVTTLQTLSQEVTTLQTSPPEKGHISTSTTTDPFRREQRDTRSTQLLTGTTQSLMTNYIPTISHGQRQLGMFGGQITTQGETSKPSQISQVQSDQQVTNLSTSLSDTLFVSRPISSIGMVNNGRLTAESHTYTSRRGKAPPIDSFTAEDIGLTFDDWLPTLE